eukprot:gene4620-3310_t
MQAKLVSALDTLFYFKHRQLLREGFEKIFESSLPQQAPLNFSLVSVVQYYPHGNKILRDPDVLATLTKLFTVTNDVSGLQNEAIQEVLINVVGEFARLEGELVRLRRKDKPKPALHLLSESEYQILMDHKYQLEQNIESLDKQVNFLREAKKKTEDKFRDQIDKQTQQLARLNEELEQATREKNESVTALTEKDTKLQSTLVLLSSAQEEIRHLLQEKSQSKLKDKQDAAEINDMIQRHSKYSAAQFTQLSAQLDAVRLELKKEKAERLREREDSSRDNNQLKKKLEVTEAMLDSVNKRFSDVAAVGLHNYNVQTGTAIDIPSIARKELSNQHHDEVLSLRSESRGDPRDEGDDRDPEQRMRKDPLRSLPHHQSRSRSSSRPKARYYQQVEGKRPEQRPYSHEGPVKSLRDRSVQRALQAEDNRRRSRSESPAFRGKHIMYQPAAIQTPFSHGQPLAQHPLRSSLGNNIEDLAQRLVYSQETSVLSPNSKRKQLSGADSTLLSHDFANGDHQLRQQRPHGDQASITAVTGGSSVVDTDSSTAGVGDGGARAVNNNGGAAVQALLSDHESDALSSIPRPDGEDDEDDDHVLVFDGQHGHPYQTSGGLALNTSPKTLSHRTGGERGAPSTVSTQRMTEYLYDAERYEPGLAHQPTTPQGAPFHHPDFPLLNALNQPAASASPDRHPSSSARQSTSSAVGSASFAVSSSLPSSPHRSPRTSMDHHPRETEKALMSPLTSPSPQQNSPPWRKQQQQHAHGIKNEMAVQTERSDHLMEHMRGGSYSSPVTGQHKTVGSTHTAPFTVAEQPADIALKFTRIVPPAFTPKELALPDAAAIHRSYSDHAEHPTPSLMARGDGRSTTIDALRAQYGSNSGGDGDETVVSMNTATIHHPNHASGPEANEGKSTWNILFQKKEYLSMDAPQTSSASQLPPSTSAAEKNVYIAKSLFQQVLDVYNQTIDDYNALLRAHREEYAEHERIKSDFKEEIYESVAKIHDLQTKLHALSLENDHLQSVLNKRGLDGMTVISQPDESVLLHQQQLLLNQQTQEMLQQMQSRWLESEQKVADLVAQAAAQQQQQQLDLRSLHEQLEQTRQALEEMKETQQAEARRQQLQQQQQDEGHDEQSLLKLLLDSSKHHALGSDHSRMSRTQKKLSSSLLLPTNDAHYQEDLQYISDMKSRLDHLHQLLAKDPKYRQYVTSPSDEGDHGRGDDEREEPDEHEGDDDDDAAGDAEVKAQMEAEQMQYLMVAKVELEDRLIRAEARVQLLTQQLESMPPSLTVAQAEKRVLEAKLSKAIEAHDFNMQKLQANAVTKIQEINAFLDLERQEKEQLQEQLRDAQATIHRLTHHLKMLQAAHETRGTREALLQAGHTGATAHHHTATPRMSTATALDILKQPSPLVSYSTTGATSVREAALSTLGLSLGTPAPWEAGAVPRTHQQSSVPAPSAAAHSAGGGEHSSAHATGSAPPSRRVTPTRSRPGSAKPSPSKSPSSSATSHRHRAQANDHNHHHPSAHAHAGSPNATSRKASRAATSEPFLGRAQQTPHQTVNSSFTQPLFHR